MESLMKGAYISVEGPYNSVLRSVIVFKKVLSCKQSSFIIFVLLFLVTSIY
jgi:hypothetical protein